MFCKNCGKELEDDATFCPVCGTKRTEIPDKNNMQDIGAESEQKEMNMETKNRDSESNKEESGKRQTGGNLISRIWNSPLFTKTAIKFGNVLEILEGIVFLILSRFLFNEGGFWGIAFGILALLSGLGGCINGITSLVSRRKGNSESEIPDEAAINKKKRNLCIGVVVIVIAFVVLKNTGGGTYSIVKAISFDDMGTETIGELVEENIKNPEWSQKKLDGNSKLVYVEGYCPTYGEAVRIEFYYEKLKDGSHEVSLSGMYWPESEEEFNTLEAALVWATFYN